MKPLRTVTLAAMSMVLLLACGGNAKAQTDTRATPGSVKPFLQWDHQHHSLRFCATQGAKECPSAALPAGLTHIRGIISTSIIPGTPNGFVVFNRNPKTGRLDTYLGSAGIDNPARIGLQRVPMPDPALGPVSVEAGKAYFQNTVSLLANRQAAAASGMLRASSINAECSNVGYDEETGEIDCEGEGGGGGGGSEGGEPTDPGAGPYSEIPGEGGYPGGSGGSPDIGYLTSSIDAGVASEFAYGMGEFDAAMSKVPMMKCATVVSQCRDSCSSVQTWATTGCAAIGVGLGIALTPAIGAAAGFYCAGQVLVAAETCRFGCNTPHVRCSPL